MKEIKHKYLYKAKKSFTVEGRNGNRKVFIEKDEVVEFRFFTPANFRTHDNIYCRMSEHEFKSSFIVYGKVWEKVSWANKTNLDVILEHGLYDKVVE